MRGAIVSAFGAPPIDGLGTTGGFKIDRRGPRQPGPRRTAARQRRDRRPGQPDARPAGPVQQSRGPTPPGSIWTSTAPSAWPWACRWATSFNTLQIYLGSFYVNNFNEFGRTWQVNVQADQNFRKRRPRYPAAPGPQQSRADDPPGHADGRHATPAARSWSCATTCTPPPPSPATPPRASARAEPSA